MLRSLVISKQKNNEISLDLFSNKPGTSHFIMW